MKRLIFPLINAVAIGMMLGLIGYYLFNPVRWLLIGAGFGFGIGLLVEFVTGRVGGWLYRRRVTLLVLLEIPLMVFAIGPYAYVLGVAQPQSGDICCATPSDFGTSYTDVAIEVADGETLRGWYIAPTADHGAAIIVAHGSGGDRTTALWHIEQLAKAGYGVLAYDQRALGESSGDTRSWGWLDARDVPFLVDFLAAQPEVNPERIGGVGLSLGAHILMLAGRDEPRLAAFFMDGAGATTLEDFPAPENFSEQFAMFMNGLTLKAMQFHLGVAPPPSLRETIVGIAPRPLLMVVSPLDTFEFRISQGYVDILGENGAQWVIENAGHVGGPAIIPEEYTARMLAFFDAAFAV
jgi:pimeloyl-ACP methyl ester carboxylesterase